MKTNSIEQQLVRVKTTDLIDASLDWAVCLVRGLKPEDIKLQDFGPKLGYSLYRNLRDADGQLNGRYQTGPDLLFSRNWVAGGPLFEKEIDNFERRGGYFYTHRFKRRHDSVDSNFKTLPGDREAWAHGPTLLSSGMRCYVLSQLGEYVDIPQCLLPSKS